MFFKEIYEICPLCCVKHTGPNWWEINFGSANALMLFGSKQFPEPMQTKTIIRLRNFEFHLLVIEQVQ